MLDHVFHLAAVQKISTGVLDCVFDKDAELGVRRGCLIECLTGMLD